MSEFIASLKDGWVVPTEASSVGDYNGVLAAKQLSTMNTEALWASLETCVAQMVMARVGSADQCASLLAMS